MVDFFYNGYVIFLPIDNLFIFFTLNENNFLYNFSVVTPHTLNYLILMYSQCALLIQERKFRMINIEGVISHREHQPTENHNPQESVRES